jgi:ABC-2 type transport system permease protein
MKGAFLLFLLSLKRSRFLLGTAGLLLMGVQIMRVSIAASIHTDQKFELLSALIPEQVRGVIGPALSSIMTFDGLVCGVFYDTGFVVVMVGVAIALATVPASEIETGFADLMLARPMSRHWLITRAIALVVFAVVFLLAAMEAGTLAGLKLFAPAGAPWPSLGVVARLALSLALLSLALSGIAMALGAGCRRGFACTVTSLFAFVSLILDWAHRLHPSLNWIAWISPFSYFQPYDLVGGAPLGLGNLFILGGIAIAGYALAYVIIRKRDISR